MLTCFMLWTSFKDIIDECGFMDLGFVAPKFTWSKHFEDGHSIWERLNIGMATSNWFLQFPGSWVTHQHCVSSIHTPLLIYPTGLEVSPRKKMFHLEEMWLSDARCAETVEAALTSTGEILVDNDV